MDAPTLSETTSPLAAVTAVADRSPDAPALVLPGQGHLGYADLASLTRDLIGALEAIGTAPGDCVAVVLPDGADAAVLFLALVTVATCCPLNPAYTQAEYETVFAHLRPSALVVQRDLSAKARRAAESQGIAIIEVDPRPAPDAEPFRVRATGRTTRTSPSITSPDEALLLQTSGTTSEGKLVPFTRANIMAAATASCRAYALDSRDCRLNVMPMFHVQGLIGSILASLVCGSTVVCAPNFEPSALLRWLDEFPVTWFSASPTMHRRILDAAGGRPSRSSLRFVRSGSAALPEALLQELTDFYEVPVTESYGMTEAHQIASTPLEPMPGPRGLVPTGSRVAILSADGEISEVPGRRGEIVISGANVIGRYAHPESANRSAFVDGWLRTGDEGELLSNGVLRITGRLKELINRGGEKISPREVEDALLAHASVRESLVFSVPDPALGEDVAAAIVVDGTVSDRELRAFAARSLAPYKLPRRIVRVDALPVTDTGKPSRRAARELLTSAGPEETTAPSGGVSLTPLERHLVEIWNEALGRQDVGLHDDFVELGGESLAATALLAMVRDILGAEITPLTLFDRAASVDAMAKLIVRMREES
jgi:acyl-CoA synthetase (AMP-forming)/AMP-acid ligase II